MLILVLFLVIAGCMHEDPVCKRPQLTKYHVKNSHGVFKVHVQNHFIFDEEGYASYYSSGHTTSTGEKFISHYYTAAHPYLPLPCIAEVSLLSNPSKKIIVKINDRGPFTKHKRIIDLSYGAAQHLGFIKAGLAKVKVKVLIKETLQLKEHGGHIKWHGEIPYEQAKSQAKKH